LPRYAEAQLALATQSSRLLAAGTPDRSPAQLPAEFGRLLSELAARPVEDGGFTTEQVGALERVPGYEDWCAELAASPIPDSLQHDDLHSNNVCWPRRPDELDSVRIIDWGDAGQWMTRGCCGFATRTSNPSATSAVGRSCYVG
jgi:phosphotransferase family enzyme